MSCGISINRDLNPLHIGKFTKGIHNGIQKNSLGNACILILEGIIQIDITKGILNVKVSDEEMAQRKIGWTPNEPKIKTGYLKRYSKLVSSAMQGAVMLDD